jgi:adenine C2-methylase RlmN of 23S rRNA A2503 and tRNA A37
VLQKFVEFARTLPAPFPIKLQLSLQTPFEQERQKLIPTARKPLARTIKVLDEYTAVSGQPVKYNIVLMDSKDGSYTNATPPHAKAVARLLLAPSLFDGTPVSRILKLSVYNSFPGAAFVPVSEATTQRYIETLRENGVTAIKTFKGSGIAIDEEKNTGGFSCGQLAVTTRKILATATH